MRYSGPQLNSKSVHIISRDCHGHPITPEDCRGFTTFIDITTCDPITDEHAEIIRQKIIDTLGELEDEL